MPTSPEQRSTRRQPFQLTRYFSLVSLGLIAAVAIALAYQAQAIASRELNNMAERRNEAMAAVFLNALWQDLSPLLHADIRKEASSLRAAAESRNLHRKAAALMRNSEIVKVKLYDSDGLTVYSSDPKQIGEDKRDNAGFQLAMSGTALSALTHRDRFDAFEGTRAELDLIASYLPIRNEGKTVLGVIEVYQDVTPFVQRTNHLLKQIFLAGASIMLGLYFLQLLLVKRAQGILQGQEEALHTANSELDQRVHERTAELHLAKARLEHLAHHDPLTGLPNRLLCNEHLKRAVARAERQGHQLAVIFIDLDNFKEVNDTLGHAAGDELLLEVAQRLSLVLRASDILARLGGDEFVCVIDGEDVRVDAAQVARKLLDALNTPVLLHGQETRASASIGIALYPADGHTADELARAADTAMYAAKRAGRQQFHFYQLEMTHAAQERAHMDRLLRRSIALGELTLHYQIKLDAQDPSRPCGAEALLRWTHPELGAVPPSRFIALAEESGYILELGEWALREACQQMSNWRASGFHMPHVSVNLSVMQLERGDFVAVVRRVLEDTGLPPEALELEITESVIMKAGDALSVLQDLKQLGVRLAIDDFGTGYSSLAYLKLLPIQALKIDRSFVAGIGHQFSDEAIILAVIALANSLGLNTVAEGVETESQWHFLRERGCHQVQGFWFGRPTHAEALRQRWAPLTTQVSAD